jgi:hypothetical protein
MQQQLIPGYMATRVNLVDMVPAQVTSTPSVTDYKQLQQLVTAHEPSNPLFKPEEQYKDHIKSRWEQRQTKFTNINQIPLHTPVIIYTPPTDPVAQAAFIRLENVYQVVHPTTAMIYGYAEGIFCDARTPPTSLVLPSNIQLYYGNVTSSKLISRIWSDHNYDVRSYKIYSPGNEAQLTAQFPGYWPNVLTSLAHDLKSKHDQPPVLLGIDKSMLDTFDQQNLREFCFI